MSTPYSVQHGEGSILPEGRVWVCLYNNSPASPFPQGWMNEGTAQLLGGVALHPKFVCRSSAMTDLPHLLKKTRLCNRAGNALVCPVPILGASRPEVTRLEAKSQEGAAGVGQETAG